MKHLRYFIVILVCFLLGTSGVSASPSIEVSSRTGVKAWLVEDHRLPIITIQFAFRGGVEQDPVEQQGLAVLTMNLLTEGAGNRDAAAFQKELADHSITMNFAASRDALEGGMKFLSEDKAHAFALLRDAIQNPRFDAESLERLKARQRAAVRSQLGSPEWQARYSLFQYIFSSHPYGFRSLGTERSIASMTRADVRKFYSRHIARDNLVIGVAGDITPKDLVRYLDYVFRDLPPHAKLNGVQDAVIPNDGQIILTSREGTQSSLLFAVTGPRRDNPDWYAAEIANYILGGGGFSSRLMQQVRGEKGLTYGISTGLSAMEHGAVIVGQAATKNADAGEAWKLIRATLQEAYDDGVKADEVEQAKNYLIGSMPLALTSLDKIAAIQVDFQLEQRDRDYLVQRKKLLAEVTRDDVNRVIRKYFQPDKMILSVVGKPEGLTPTQTKHMTKE